MWIKTSRVWRLCEVICVKILTSLPCEMWTVPSYVSHEAATLFIAELWTSTSNRFYAPLMLGTTFIITFVLRFGEVLFLLKIVSSPVFLIFWKFMHFIFGIHLLALTGFMFLSTLCTGFKKNVVKMSHLKNACNASFVLSVLHYSVSQIQHHIKNNTQVVFFNPFTRNLVLFLWCGNFSNSEYH